jgi:hypothetical protein
MKRVLLIVFVGALFVASFPGLAAASGVAGTVTPTAIAPEVEVCMVEPRPSETCTAPDANGEYVLGGLPAGIPLAIEFIPSYRSRYLIQFYKGVRTLAGATKIILPPRELLDHIDADLELGGAIEGTVTAASSGMPIAGVEACAREAGTGVSYGCTDTGELGTYALGDLPPGSYVVSFFGHGVTTEYEPKSYNDQATAIPLAAGETVTGIDVAMTRGAKVTGTVVAAATGFPLQGVSACLIRSAALMPDRCVYSGPGGSYAFEGIPAGEYQVGFSLGSAEIDGERVSAEEDGYLTQFYRGAANRSEAQVLSLSDEEVASGVDGALLMPLQPPPIVPSPPPPINLIVAPPPVSPPVRPGRLHCKRGYLRKHVRGVEKCIKKAKKSRRRSKRKRHSRAGHH